MFTFILYWNVDRDESGFHLENFDFLFSFAEMQNKMVKQSFDGQCESAVQEINLATEHLRDWKLVLFDGRFKRAEEVTPFSPENIRPGWSEVLRKIFPKDLDEDSSLTGFLPREVWYIGCWGKNVYVPQKDSDFARPMIWVRETEKNNPKSDHWTRQRVHDFVTIPSLRMCWTEISPESGMRRRQEELRLCCMLLILACNDIPPSFMSGDFLYHLRIQLDRERLAAYVGQLSQQNEELGEQIQKEIERYHVTEHERVSYMRPNAPPPIPDYVRHAGTGKEQEIKFKDFVQPLRLDIKLRDNRQWFYRHIYSFQEGLDRWISNPMPLVRQNRDVLLDEAGIASAQAELKEALQTIYLKRQDENNPQKTAAQLLQKEEQLRQKSKLQPERSEKTLIKLILALAEGLTFGPFGINWVSHLLENTHIHEGTAFFISTLLISLAVYFLFSLIPRISYFFSYDVEYKSFLSDEMREQAKKHENMSAVMHAIAQYRYHWRLLERQEEIKEELVRAKRHLMHHKATQKNAASVCGQLERMLGEDEYITGQTMLLPEIDFKKDPEQVEYYWFPLKGRRQTCNINNSGQTMDVIFDFISEFEVHRTPSLRNLKEGESQ